MSSRPLFQPPRIEYPAELPVSAERERIRAAIEAHQVVVICGETGSGKTTQLPKICLEMGRGAAGIIGHTQPRRIAARSVAARIAEELGTRVGQGVGFKVRFSDHVGPGTRIKLMTDGILLAETQSDPKLAAYDTLIIDEAHERSLNIDFLLGYLHRLLPRRPDLKLIITSATIDPERFARHFGDAPVIEVSGRSYPVEVRYRPLGGDAEERLDQDLYKGILDAVDELAREGPGDMLVFLPGEREIREAAEQLRKRHPPGTEILPLYGRLSAAQQNRVFAPHGGRRIVLATNVAETSLTVPGIHYVVDTGLARISRYSYRTKVQRLPVEPVSQASARQRAGRCGRIAPGVCVRLYSEEDFRLRPAFTDPEIRRTNLANVILQMLVLKLGAVEDFPFIDPPDSRFVRDGYKLLLELGAVDGAHRLTRQGRKMARMPVDVRLARMLTAAMEEGCLREMLVIASALTVPDPRERPMDRPQAADEKHRLFRHERSDFLSFLKLWDAWHEQMRHLSRNKLRKWCQEHFLSHVRMREWHDIHQQLLAPVKDMGWRLNPAEADYAAIHRALIAGLPGQIATRTDEHEYTGARGLKLHLFPGSGLFKKRPRWVVAAELVETGRRYARTVAAIEPEWVEAVLPHLVKRNHFEPHWEKRRGQVVAFERVTLYGLPLVEKRRVNFGRIDPQLAREIFIREALVPGELRSRARFLDHNRRLLSAADEAEARSRRRDLRVDDETLFHWFDARLPPEVCDAGSFDRWYRRAVRGQRDLLCLAESDVLRMEGGGTPEQGLPDHLELQGLRLPLEYHFAPGDEADGVTAVVPLAAVNQLDPIAFEWLVPALLPEKAAALIKSLPKSLRRHFVPAPDFAQAALGEQPQPGESLCGFLGRRLQQITGVVVPPDAWRPELLPAHLFMRFRLIDSNGATLAEGRELAALQAEEGARGRAQFQAAAAHPLEQDDVRDWPVEALPEHVEIERSGLVLRGYPALVAGDAGQVHLRVLDAPGPAAEAHREGLLALFRLRCARAVRHMEKNLPGVREMCLHFAPVGDCQGLTADLVRAILTRAFLAEGAVRERAAFEARVQAGEASLQAIANEVAGWVGPALAEYHQVRKRLKGRLALQLLHAARDVQAALDGLIHPGFVAATPYAQLRHLLRYVRAAGRRLDKAEQNPARDRALAAEIAPFQERLQQIGKAPAPDTPAGEALARYRWLLEEFRVSLFAQELKTAEPVSAKRLEKAWQAWLAASR